MIFDYVARTTNSQAHSLALAVSFLEYSRGGLVVGIAFVLYIVCVLVVELGVLCTEEGSEDGFLATPFKYHAFLGYICLAYLPIFF